MADSTQGAAAKVGIIMGSQSDWATMKHAADMLDEAWTCRTRCASSRPTGRRTGLAEYAKTARSARPFRHRRRCRRRRASARHVRRPYQPARARRADADASALTGMDSLLSIVQMPAGVPVGTLAIGRAGAINAALLAAAILGTANPALVARLDAWRAAQTEAVAEAPETA